MGLRLISVLALVGFAVLICGCNGGRETDQISYIVGIGIDAAPEGKVQVTYRIAVPAALSGAGEGGGAGTEKTSSLITIIAPSLAEARNLANLTLSRSLLLSHNKSFVIGEELARRGLADIVGPIKRFREYRGSMFIVVVKGSAYEFLQKNKPAVERQPSRWAEDILFVARDTGYHLPVTVHYFYRRLKGVTGAPLAAYAAVGPEDMKDRPMGELSEKERTQEYLPDGVPKKGANDVNMAGVAVFRGDKMVGTLTTEETRILAILLDEFPRGFITIADPLEPQKSINISIRNGRRPKIDTAIVDGQAKISVDVLLEGEITAISSGINYEAAEYRQLLEQQTSVMIEEEMRKMIAKTQRLDADAADFGARLAPSFNSRKEFEQFRWDEYFPQAEVDVKVTTRLRRTGLMWQTIPILMNK
jgi:spore germination protein KC